MNVDLADVRALATEQDGPSRLSVVIPTYDRDESLRRAVASVLTAAPPGIEVIIVDDGSTSSRAPSIADFPDPRVRIIRRPSNGGVAAAQNTGLFAANAPCVSFLHSDDRYLSGGAERMLERLENAPAASAVEAATERQTARAVTVLPPQLDGVGFRQFAGREVRNLHLAGWIFRTDRLRALGGFDERLRAYEDFELLLRFLQDAVVEFDGNVVAHVDAAGHDRLGLSPHMQEAQAALVDLHHASLTQDFGKLPDGWRDWAVMAAVRALQADDPASARRHLRRSLTGRWTELPKRLPLIAATSFPSRLRKRIGTRAEGAYSRQVVPVAERHDEPASRQYRAGP